MLVLLTFVIVQCVSAKSKSNLIENIRDYVHVLIEKEIYDLEIVELDVTDV